MPGHKSETYERYAKTLETLHEQAETGKAVKYRALREHHLTPRTFKSINEEFGGQVQHSAERGYVVSGVKGFTFMDASGVQHTDIFKGDELSHMGAYLGHYRAGHADTVDELAKVEVRGVSGIGYTLATYDQLQASAALVSENPFFGSGDSP